MVRNSSISNSSSRKVCPSNKFSFLSGCISWSTSLSFFLSGALLIICILIMSTQKHQHHPGFKKGDIIEEGRSSSKHLDLTVNGRTPSQHTKYSNTINRVEDIFEPNDKERNPHEGTGTPVSERIKYDINVNIRDDYPERPNRNQISSLQYEADKNMERIINPLLPPERSYTNTYGTPINIPSRGPLQSFQQIGILYKENIADKDKVPGNNSDSNILPLFGRPTFNGSKRWNYYTSSDKFQNFKIPITCNGRKCSDDTGCDEIMNGDMIDIPSYNGKFKVEIYNYDRPSYIPYVY